MGGFLIVLLIFTAAALLSWHNFGRIIAATGDIMREKEGLESALRLENEALRADAVQASLLLSTDAADIEPFREAMRNMANERARLLHLTTSEGERDLVRRCAALQTQLETIVLSQFVPAVMEGHTEDIAATRATAGRVVQEVVRLSQRLKRGFESRIALANRRANDIRNETLTYSGWLLFLAVVVAVFVAMAAARSVVTPIRNLMEATEAVARGDLERRLDASRPDEFGRLAESFNRMIAELRESQHRVVQAEKMASIGRLAAGVAHEINNPIGVILGYAKMLRSADNLPPEASEDLRAIEEEAERCREVVQGLLNLSRAVPPADTVVDLTEIVREVIDRERTTAEAAGVCISFGAPTTTLPIRAEVPRLRQVVRNLVRNALEAMPQGGSLRVALRREGPSPREPGGPLMLWAEAEFTDSGCGIPPEAMEHIFEPFFTTKPQGTGLGLAITYNVVRAYGGTIRALSEPGHGATFFLRFPLAENRSKVPPPPDELGARRTPAELATTPVETRAAPHLSSGAPPLAPRA